MPYSEQRWSRTHVELLMDIAATLADLTASPTTCEQIPSYLSKVLDLECVTLAIVNDQGEARIDLQSSSCPVAAGDPEAFTRNLLAIYQQTRPLTTSDGPTLRGNDDAQEELGAMPVQHMAAYPRATVVARTLSAQHRMLLIVHHASQEPALVSGIGDLLQLVADELAKLLSSMVAWRERLEDVGEPFERLTDREWVVLQGLMTEAGEKQLADQLGLSPHTLHSHIKSIYRKLEVQGRLPLLSKVQGEVRERRQSRLSGRRTSVAVSQTAIAVAVG